jgi:hypothetical protein
MEFANELITGGANFGKSGSHWKGPFSVHAGIFFRLTAGFGGSLTDQMGGHNWITGEFRGMSNEFRLPDGNLKEHQENRMKLSMEAVEEVSN